MAYYTRVQLLEIIGLSEGLLIELEREEFVLRDSTLRDRGDYSERMLERARVAANFVEELEVNLPGVTVYFDMRERMASQRHRIDTFLVDLNRGRG
jgi:hypothetical protein